MSRTIARAQDHAFAADRFDEGEQPTRRVHAFHLPDEARRVEEHLADARLHEGDSTLSIGPEENQRLLASVFATNDSQWARRNTDDEPTLDAPAPVTSPPPAQRLTPLPPAAAAFHIVLTSQPPPRPVPRLSVAPEAVMTLGALALSAASPEPTTGPVSGIRRKLTRDPRDVTFKIRLPKQTALETWVVAGIWAMAVSLLAVLMFMAASA